MERLSSWSTARALGLTESDRVRHSHGSRRTGVRVLARDIRTGLVGDASCWSIRDDRQGSNEGKKECVVRDDHSFGLRADRFSFASARPGSSSLRRARRPTRRIDGPLLAKPTPERLLLDDDGVGVCARLDFEALLELGIQKCVEGVLSSTRGIDISSHECSPSRLRTLTPVVACAFSTAHALSTLGGGCRRGCRDGRRGARDGTLCGERRPCAGIVDPR